MIFQHKHMFFEDSILIQTDRYWVAKLKYLNLQIETSKNNH